MGEVAEGVVGTDQLTLIFGQLGNFSLNKAIQLH